MNQDLMHKEISESIIGAAMTVLNALKPGLDEKLYERAMVIELLKRGHQVLSSVSSRCSTTASSWERRNPT